MKKYLLFIVFAIPTFFISLTMNAQNVGINASGAAPDASAMLDIDVSALGAAAKKGLLIPRVALTSRNVAGPITTPTTSLLVYNTATAGAAPNNVVPGFYYWDGASWVAFSGQGSNNWSLLGNSGTAVATNFLGTTDAVDFVIRTNNTERIRILSGGNIGIGTTTPTYRLDMRGTVAATYLANFENTSATGSALQAYNNSGTVNAFGGISNISGGVAIYGVHLQNTGGGIGVYGTSNSSNTYGVRGSVPTTGAWLGFGGVFTGGLGYVNGLYNLSDAKVKSNVEKIDNAIEKIKKINGVSYIYNSKEYAYIAGEDKRTYLGFIAQNIKEVFPEAVAEKLIPVAGPKTNTQSYDSQETTYEVLNVVDYTAIIPVLVEATKEQQVMIETQQKRIDELLKSNKELTKRLEILEKK